LQKKQTVLFELLLTDLNKYAEPMMPWQHYSKSVLLLQSQNTTSHGRHSITLVDEWLCEQPARHGIIMLC